MQTMNPPTQDIEGPAFEDLRKDEWLPEPPEVTLTEGHAAWHQALFGERLRLALSRPLSQTVLGGEHMLASPSLTCNLITGQTTWATQEVRANLFYRGLLLERPVFVGDTLRTRTRVVALKQNRPRPDRPATGLAVLEITVSDQQGRAVAHFWRCPMIPCRDPQVVTGHADDVDAFPDDIPIERLAQVVADHWHPQAFADALPARPAPPPAPGSRLRVAARDTVTCAPELVRLTLNMARAHTDAASSPYEQRLVYGGHVISIAAAQMSRALPEMMTILAWRGCDHLAPVFEGDRLRSELLVTAIHPLPQGTLVDLQVTTFAVSENIADERPVLTWRPVILMP